MMSSSSAIGSVPTHPETAQDQSAAVDEGHPERECRADEEVADQRQRSDGKPDRDKSIAEPQHGHTIHQHEVDRPERSDLARREVTENVDTEKAEREEQ